MVSRFFKKHKLKIWKKIIKIYNGFAIRVNLIIIMNDSEKTVDFYNCNNQG